MAQEVMLSKYDIPGFLLFLLRPQEADNQLVKMSAKS